MDFIDNKSEYYNIILPIVNSFGFEIVEINAKNRENRLNINIVIYSPKGISLNDCSKVHRTVQRRVEAHTGNRDLHIEVSSPGVNRNLKYANEFTVFKGKNVKLLFGDNQEWSYYIIKDTDKDNVIFETVDKNDDSSQKNEEIRIKYSEIRKAKLES